MAINEAQAKQIENESLALKGRSDRVTAQINEYVRTVNTRPDPSSELVSDGRALEAEAVDTLSAINNFYNSPTVLEGRSDLNYQSQVNESLDTIRDARNQTSTSLVDVRSTLAGIGTREPPLDSGTNSAGLIVGGDADNRSTFAVTQNPETDTDSGNLTVVVATNADETETQETIQAQIANADATGVTPTPSDVNLSRSALIDDSGLTPPSQPTSTRGLNEVPVSVGYNKEIIPQDNLLKKFATSTYNITIYLLSEDDYRRMMGFDQEANAGPDADVQSLKSVGNLKAILSSGGMPFGPTDDPLEFEGAQRAPGFDLDYFIDDVEIQTLQPQQVRGATNVTNISFTVTEPYGFTFLTKLKEASRLHTGNPDWIHQHYLMVIRFFGYEDKNVSLDDVNTGGGSAGAVVIVTAQAPLSAKYIPFKFTNITTKATTGAVEYQCSAVPINHLEAMSQKRASVKYQVEVVGQTLDDLFNGKSDLNVSQNGGNILRRGLIESINDYYLKLKRDGVIDIADEYEVIFRNGIGKFNIKPPGTTKKNRTTMAPPRTPVDPTFPTLLDSTRPQYKDNILTFSVNAGTQIQQFIDLAVRTSEYITRQQRKTLDPNTGKVEPQASNNILQWYRITSSVESLGYDNKRKDYAYKIRYYVVPSAVSDVKSGFFPSRPFNGCQKRYNYWFTGENTEILNYEVDFNALYYVSSSPDTPPDGSLVGTMGVGETTSPGPSDQSVIGGAGTSSDPAARAASVLYSPTDYTQLRLSILGDPDYIQQGDIFWRSYGVDNDVPGYLRDGSLDYDSGEILLEVNYKTIVDYDEETGVAKPVDVILKSPEDKRNTTTENGTEYNGLIYQVTEVTSKFNKGIFTQDINGIQRYASPPSSPDTQGSQINIDTNQTATQASSSMTVAQDANSIPTISQSTLDQALADSISSNQNQTVVTPTLGGLTLQGATFVAPPEP